MILGPIHQCQVSTRLCFGRLFRSLVDQCHYPLVPRTSNAFALHQACRRHRDYQFAVQNDYPARVRTGRVPLHRNQCDLQNHVYERRLDTLRGTLAEAVRRCEPRMRSRSP